MSKFDYFAKLPDGYECQLAQTDGDTADSCSTLRLNLKTADEWRTWLHKFEAEFCTTFVVKQTYSNPIRCALCFGSLLDFSFVALAITNKRTP